MRKDKTNNRLAISLTDTTMEALNNLQDNYPMLNRGSIIEMCIINAVNAGGLSLGHAGPKKAIQSDLRAKWCSEVGGTVKNGTCTAVRYGYALNGRLTGSKDVMPLINLPTERAEFMKYYLSNLKDVDTAREALSKQDKEDAKRMIEASKAVKAPAIEEINIEEGKSKELTRKTARDKTINATNGGRRSGEAMADELRKLEALAKNKK